MVKKISKLLFLKKLKILLPPLLFFMLILGMKFIVDSQRVEGFNNTIELIDLRQSQQCTRHVHFLVGSLPRKCSLISIERAENRLLKRFDLKIQAGGRGYYDPCTPHQEVAIIVASCDGSASLGAFLEHYHPILARQKLNYGIYVMKLLNGTGFFDRALLFDTGFLETQKLYNYSCFIFHDDFLLMGDDRNMYDCSRTPAHHSVNVKNSKTRLDYLHYFGGVKALTKEQFNRTGGFSVGVRMPDDLQDDMYIALSAAGYKVFKPAAELGHYWNLHSTCSVLAEPRSSRARSFKMHNARLKNTSGSPVVYKGVHISYSKLFTSIQILL